MVLLTIVLEPASPSWPSGDNVAGFTRFRGMALPIALSSFLNPSVLGLPSDVVGERALPIALSFRVAGREVVSAELFRVNIVHPAVDREDVEPDRAKRSFKAVWSRPRLEAASNNCLSARESFAVASGCSVCCGELSLGKPFRLESGAEVMGSGRITWGDVGLWNVGLLAGAD